MPGYLSIHLELDDSANYAILIIEDSSSDLGEHGLWCVLGLVFGSVSLRVAAHIWKTADWDWDCMSQFEKPNEAKGPIR